MAAFASTAFSTSAFSANAFDFGQLAVQAGGGTSRKLKKGKRPRHHWEEETFTPVQPPIIHADTESDEDDEEILIMAARLFH